MDMPNKDKLSTQLNGRKIFVIGPQRLLNRLLVFYLEATTGATCIEGGDHKVYDPAQHDGDQTLLFLIDCKGRDIDSFLLEFEPLKEMVNSQHHVAPFNVNPDLGEEEKALEHGIRGFFYERETLEQLEKGIRVIFSDELWVSREILTKHILYSTGRKPQTKNTSPVLTAREHEILTLIAAGAKNDAIADKLCISPNTVRTHIYNIFKKINVPNRLQAALWAVQNL